MKLTAIRQSILRFIIQYMEDNTGRAPTNREIGEYIQSTSTGHIAYHLEALEEAGYIEREDNKSRTIRVLKDAQGRPLPGWHQTRSWLPIKGPIAAGQQLTIPDEADELLEFSMQNFSEQAFGLQVQGLSMVDYGIFDGDYIIIEPGIHFEQGDIVVATHRSDNAATVKHFYRTHDGRVKLQPANATMDPIYVDAQEWDNEWEVQGTVKAVFRVFDRLRVKKPRSAMLSTASLTSD